MSVYDTPIAALDGTPGVLADEKGKVTLLVNVASFCGLTPQYEGLEQLDEKFGRRASRHRHPVQPVRRAGAGHAPTRSRRSAAPTTTCTFPLTEKIEVNGDDRHPLYQELTPTADAEGHTGDIRWNFEKFLVGRDGEIVARFSPMVEPETAEVAEAIEKALAA